MINFIIWKSFQYPRGYFVACNRNWCRVLSAYSFDLLRPEVPEWLMLSKPTSREIIIGALVLQSTISAHDNSIIYWPMPLFMMNQSRNTYRHLAQQLALPCVGWHGHVRARWPSYPRFKKSSSAIDYHPYCCDVRYQFVWMVVISFFVVGLLDDEYFWKYDSFCSASPSVAYAATDSFRPMLHFKWNFAWWMMRFRSGTFQKPQDFFIAEALLAFRQR